jgi:multisubunit Na+/H+ antiporter MnhE subunit
MTRPVAGPRPAPGNGGPRGGRSPDRRGLARRAGAWLLWWVLLMSFWVVLDQSTDRDELLAGAGAAILGAFLAELVTYQAATRLRLRIDWLVPALRLPADIARDTGIIFAALWRRLRHGEQPPSGFRVQPARYGDDSLEGKTRRALLVGGRSIAPNSFVLGIDAGRDVMVVHQLVVNQGRPEPPAPGPEPAVAGRGGPVRAPEPVPAPKEAGQ